MTDQVIGRCSKCGGSFTAGHNCEPKNPFGGLNLMTMRFDEIKKRLDVLEGKKKQPQPAPSLVETVERYDNASEDGGSLEILALYWGEVKQALARERRIAEKRDEVLNYLRTFRLHAQADKVLAMLDTLDEECAK